MSNYFWRPGDPAYPLPSTTANPLRNRRLPGLVVDNSGRDGAGLTCLDNRAALSQAPSRRSANHVAPATSADAGIVRIHAQTIRPATPQRTAEKRWIAPTPMIEPVIVCVVLTGIPAKAVPISVIAPAVSAQKPPKGRSLVMRMPMVFTIRQPPAIVPSPRAACAASTTQNGT